MLVNFIPLIARMILCQRINPKAAPPFVSVSHHSCAKCGFSGGTQMPDLVEPIRGVHVATSGEPKAKEYKCDDSLHHPLLCRGEVFHPHTKACCCFFEH